MRTWMKKLVLLYLVCLLLLIISACDHSRQEPLGHIYRVTASVDPLGNENHEQVIVKIDVFGNLLIAYDMQTMEFEHHGEFIQSKQQEDTWVIDEDGNSRYILCWESDDLLTLTLKTGEQELWKYKLDPVDMISVNVSSAGVRSNLEIDWYYADTFCGALSQLSKATVSGQGKMGIQVTAEEITELLVYEEYCANGAWESFAHTLNRDDGFSLDLVTRYPGGDQYALYRIPYENGEFIFYIEFSP